MIGELHYCTALWVYEKPSIADLSIEILNAPLVGRNER